MSFSNPTAPASFDAMLSEIKTFLTADSWALSYDDISATTVGSQLGMSKGNCFLAIGEENNTKNPIDRSDLWNSITVKDAELYMSVNHSLNATNKQFWGHPDGTPNVNIVSTATDADRIIVNDLWTTDPAFSNMWLLSGASKNFCWVVMESGDRYTVFGFGNLDKKGMTHPDVGFCTGLTYRWWPDSAVLTSQTHSDPGSTNHKIGILNEPDLTANAMLFLKDTVVDPALGFTDGDYQTRALSRTLLRGTFASEEQGINNSFHFMLNYFLSTNNQSTTGGQVLSALAALVDQNSLVHFVGEYPDIRLVNIGNLVPGSTIKYGSEEWLVFPFKRKGQRAHTDDGANPKPFVNSIEYGFAIKKTV